MTKGKKSLQISLERKKGKETAIINDNRMYSSVKKVSKRDEKTMLDEFKKVGTGPTGVRREKISTSERREVEQHL